MKKIGVYFIILIAYFTGISLLILIMKWLVFEYQPVANQFIGSGIKAMLITQGTFISIFNHLGLNQFPLEIIQTSNDIMKDLLNFSSLDRHKKDRLLNLFIFTIKHGIKKELLYAKENFLTKIRTFLYAKRWAFGGRS